MPPAANVAYKVAYGAPLPEMLAPISVSPARLSVSPTPLKSDSKPWNAAGSSSRSVPASPGSDGVKKSTSCPLPTDESSCSTAPGTVTIEPLLV